MNLNKPVGRLGLGKGNTGRGLGRGRIRGRGLGRGRIRGRGLGRGRIRGGGRAVE